MDVEPQPLVQPTVSKNGKPEEHIPETQVEPKTNGNTNKKESTSPKNHTPSRKNRSRSRTPAKKGKKNEEESKTNAPEAKKIKKNEDSDKLVDEAKILTVTLQKIDQETNNEKTEEVKEIDKSPSEELKDDINTDNQKEPLKSEEHVEMDPLVLPTDEPDPELQFDENSDMESGKGSPVLHRCRTRRSQNRNVPTPKTPKSVDSDSDKNSVPPTPDPSENETKAEKTINDSSDIVNFSIKPQVGSDVTRMEYIDRNSLLINDDSYLNECREKSLSETLRSLSARRSIRSTSIDYRKRAFENSVNKPDLNVTYPTRKSVESVTTGVKRKGRSITPEETKKFKTESPTFGSIFTSPINNFRNRLRGDIISSTPKLMAYKDDKDLQKYDLEELNVPERKNWCSIM